MFRITDDTGIVLFGDHVPRYNGIDIFILPQSTKHRVQIGRVNFDNRTFYIHRDSTKHVLKKANAYGFNHYILSNAERFDRVAIKEIDTNKMYCVERQFILKEGQFLHFKQQGLEKQIFVTLEWLAHYEVTNPLIKNTLIAHSKPTS